MKADMLRNPVKERMTQDEAALGLIVRMARTGDIARIARTSGHDFLFVDTQHAAFSIETIADIGQVALGCGVACFVRVRSCHDPDTSRLLDAGATGIIFPDVNTADEARLAVRTCLFPPLGARSFSGSYPVFDHRPVPAQKAMAALNEMTTVVCMIETAEGLANVEAIAAVDGIDVLHVGCNDLLNDLGKPGEFGGAEMTDAMGRVMRAARAHGRFCGLGGDKDLERQARYIRAGVRFVTTQSDTAMLLAEASERVGSLRKAASLAP